MPVTRTQDEIVARIHEVKDADFFGFETGELLGALDYAHAKTFIKADTTPEAWAEATESDNQGRTIDQQFADYMVFAQGKATDHRGLSAGRSVTKLNAMAWLMGFEPILTVEYPQYGAPILKALCERHSLPWPADNEGLNRMAQGLPCHEGCQEGCDS